MKRFTGCVVTKTETPYTVEAETAQDAIERVLSGAGEAGDPDYSEPDIFVKPLGG
ncbi:MAG: hypothetical protein JWM78_3427 [Verrucomicrobiaceae bacterium]|nr:hypothetical protein [Verrucomicrobiaceae bacterium]